MPAAHPANPRSTSRRAIGTSIIELPFWSVGESGPEYFTRAAPERRVGRWKQRQLPICLDGKVRLSRSKAAATPHGKARLTQCLREKHSSCSLELRILHNRPDLLQGVPCPMHTPRAPLRARGDRDPVGRQTETRLFPKTNIRYGTREHSWQLTRQRVTPIAPTTRLSLQ